MIYDDDQTLLLDDRFFRRVLDGSITASLRIGERPIQPGRLVFLATNGGYLPATVYVERIINTSFAGISDTDAILAGYEDGDAARQAILYFQPAIVGSTPVAVIRFERD